MAYQKTQEEIIDEIANELIARRIAADPYFFDDEESDEYEFARDMDIVDQAIQIYKNTQISSDDEVEVVDVGRSASKSVGNLN